MCFNYIELFKNEVKNMMQRIKLSMGKLADQKGFTLVEMALVLIIIGIIIGAIVKGKDLVRGAEQKRIYSKFLNGWRLGYLNFYDRTGKLLGDSYDTPNTAAGQDGQTDTAGGVAGAPSDTPGRDALISGAAAYLGLSDVGLDVPSSNVPGTAYQYRYVNSLGSTNLLDIAFDWDAVNNRNVMLINNIPAELALAMDTMVDGEADGTVGDFVRDTGAAWDVTTAVTVNTAHWVMQF